MALDTKARRGSAICHGSPWRSWLSEPAGTIDEPERKSLLKLAAIETVVAAPVITSPSDDPHAVEVWEGQTAVISVSFLGVPLSEQPAFSGTDAALFIVVPFANPEDYTSPINVEFVDPAEIGTYEVTLTLENATGTDSVTLNVEVVADPRPANTVAPYIIYGGFVGRSQTVDDGTWDNTPTSFLYRWGRANDGSGTGAALITGATSAAYTPTAADEGKYLYCEVAGVNAYGTSSYTRSSYRFCFPQVSLPAATPLEDGFTDLSSYDGKLLFTETVTDSAAEMPDPLTWKDEAPQNGIDLSAYTCAVDNGTQTRGNIGGAVKISQKCYLFAQHVPGNGDGYVFLNKDDDSEVVGVANINNRIRLSEDLSIGVFDSPVDDADIPNMALPTAGLYNATAGRECLAVELNRHLNRLMLDAGNTASGEYTEWAPTTADVIESGDSGKPVFVLVGTTPVLLGMIYTATSAPNVAKYLNEIAAVVDYYGDTLTLVSRAGGGGLTTLRGSISGCYRGLTTEEEQA